MIKQQMILPRYLMRQGREQSEVARWLETMKDSLRCCEDECLKESKVFHSTVSCTQYDNGIVVIKEKKNLEHEANIIYGTDHMKFGGRNASSFSTKFLCDCVGAAHEGRVFRHAVVKIRERTGVLEELTHRPCGHCAQSCRCQASLVEWQSYLERHLAQQDSLVFGAFLRKRLAEPLSIPQEEGCNERMGLFLRGKEVCP
jgi:hypothetical protein